MLKRLFISGAKIEAFGYIVGQLLRFLSSLILSRLLFPEAFGLATLVAVVTQGLFMLSDVGIGQSVIQHPRGDDQRFLDTAWTMLIVRGVALWIAASLVALPLSLQLNQPALAYLIPVGSLGLIISGAASTSLISRRRRLDLKPIVIVDLLSQVVALISTALLAWWLRSVWALVIGGLIGAGVKTAASYLLHQGQGNRFTWDRNSVDEIFGYGKWIFGSSALSFVSLQADRVLMAHYVGVAALGIYSYALLLSEALSAAVVKITHGVLFPAFSRVNREKPRDLQRIYYKVRLRSDAMTLIPTGLLCALAQPTVNLLFDPRYSDAGWMLQALCVRAAMTIVLSPVETVLFSAGHSRFGFYRGAARLVWVIVGIPVGWHLGGIEGLVWAVALSEIPVLLTLWPAFYRLGYLRVTRELLALVFFLVAFGAGWGALRLFYARV